MIARRIVVAIAVLCVLAASAVALVRFREAGTIYPKLSAIMEEADRAWLKNPGLVDMSEAVCPLVSVEAMERVYSGPHLAVNIKYRFYEKDVLNTAPVLPLKRWFISKRTGIFSSNVLAITLSDTGYCEAGYIRDSL